MPKASVALELSLKDSDAVRMTSLSTTAVWRCQKVSWVMPEGRLRHSQLPTGRRFAVAFRAETHSVARLLTPVSTAFEAGVPTVLWLLLPQTVSAPDMMPGGAGGGGAAGGGAGASGDIRHMLF